MLGGKGKRGGGTSSSSSSSAAAAAAAAGGAGPAAGVVAAVVVVLDAGASSAEPEGVPKGDSGEDTAGVAGLSSIYISIILAIYNRLGGVYLPWWIRSVVAEESQAFRITEPLTLWIT